MSDTSARAIRCARAPGSWLRKLGLLPPATGAFGVVAGIACSAGGATAAAGATGTGGAGTGDGGGVIGRADGGGGAGATGGGATGRAGAGAGGGGGAATTLGPAFAKPEATPALAPTTALSATPAGVSRNTAWQRA